MFFLNRNIISKLETGTLLQMGRSSKQAIFGSVDSDSRIAKLVNGANSSRLVNSMVYGRYI